MIDELQDELGLTVKRFRVERKKGEKMIRIWSDNSDYADHRRWMTLSEV